MRLAVPKETRAGETRVAATPESVKKFKSLGLEVVVQAGAGAAARVSDADYAAAGATIAPDAASTLKDADIVLKVRGVESGGLVEGLPVHNFRTESGEIAMKCPTEVQITDRREKELADLGFAPLVHQKGTPNAAFFSVQSAQKPKVYDDPNASSSARLSAQLPYIFSTSRFAHYLKVMMRDKIGGYTTRGETEAFLNRWIQNYVAPTNAPASMKSKCPLAEARIDVVEVPGKPGVYRAIAFMKPHFQLDELSVSMRLVADLPAAAK